MGMLLGLAGGLAAQDKPSTTEQTASASATQESTAQVSAAQSNESAQPVAAAKENNGAAAGDSHVRIVRLSEAQGTLAMDRGTGKGYEPTMQNMPIVEGSRLQTDDDGYAEVEFEDGSTMRLAPDSRVEFPLLVLRSGGAKASTVNVVRGTVYVSLENTQDNEFTLKAGQAAMRVTPSTHLRVEIAWPKMAVSVFAGDVQVQSGGATTMVGKKQSATLDATDASKVEVTKKVAAATYDGWDKDQVDYHKRYAARGNAFKGGGYGYGVSDLNYYGSFVNSGCGALWQPYFASAAWDPYGNGAWAYYPGAGYSWVSPYPWGWLPYHSGAWTYCSGLGWGWQPGGSWRGLNNVTNTFAQPLPGKTGQVVSNTGVVGPPRPPVTPISTLVMANRTPLVISKEGQPGNFVFQKNSAGMGVPRGSLGELKGIASGVEHHGSASIPVYVEPRGPQGAPGTPGHPMNSAPVALRQGSPNGGSPNGGMHENHAPSSPSGGSFHSTGGNASGGAASHAGSGAPSGGSSGGNGGRSK